GTGSAGTGRRRSVGGGARPGRVPPPPPPPRGDPETPGETPPEVEIEYVTEEPEIYDPNFVFFKRIFEAFKLTDDVKKDKEKEPERAERAENAGAPPEKGTRGRDQGQRRGQF
ncbi:splicing factor 3B subunit 2-like, partial [Neopelma chrysocephalum]|uniref:splicing factor 3B subunit 2-like n=1 Tax=Neopelma chrysocephalum TaxID=114329 RepID=UPI000FCD2B14